MDKSTQRVLQVQGIVQGIGFRPMVWRLANDLGLNGWVRNDAGGVTILIQGEIKPIEIFTRRLINEIPPLGQIHNLSYRDNVAEELIAGFNIVASNGGINATMIGPDIAICHDCCQELFDPEDRRWRYAFINCVNCGPRYTITRELPYDRVRTSMAQFPLCPKCAAEYHNPAARRFHAEAIACPQCGPHLWIESLKQKDFANVDPIRAAVMELRAGEILALKGIGGFHLACDARNPETVKRLRERKLREAKPFALMMANIATITQWVAITDCGRDLLTRGAAPIVLMQKRPHSDAVFPEIAPGLAHLGVMLPYAPLHWLLLHEAAGRPSGVAWLNEPQELILVLTSANPSGAPLVISNQDARERLVGLADALVLHNRAILTRCDDSVARCDNDGQARLIRRARGYTPQGIRLARGGPTVMALGGLLKNAICVTRGAEAFLSQHIGGLDHPEAAGAARELTRQLGAILHIRPTLIAHDLHPDFPSTSHAQELAAELHIPTIAVQHHHAHIAAVLAEHGFTAPALGLAMDGVGIGSDNHAWGGELLLINGAEFTRIGHLTPLLLPGGDRAAHEPWRMAAAVLYQIGRGVEISQRFACHPLALHLKALLSSGRHCPPTTSLGRYFDAAAGLLGIATINAYEGQAAMRLESLAEQFGAVPPFRDADLLHADGSLDFLPLLARLADERDAGFGAALFHATVAQALAEWTTQSARRSKIDTIALGGGCFLNQVLTRRLIALLKQNALHILQAQQVPPNDGGLSLGQAWIALQTFAEL